MNEKHAIETLMRNSWNKKAKTNAYHWVDSSKQTWQSITNYYSKGEQDTEKYLINPIKKFGFNPQAAGQQVVLDIGCGTGRLCRALSKIFGEVHGIDISQHMLEIANRDNGSINNITFHLGNGIDLSGFKSQMFDYIFSFIVFQHIPDKRIINNYISEMYRTLKAGGIARFQVRGYPGELYKNLPNFCYMGFNTFYCAIDLKKRYIPYPIIKKYGTVYGAFYKKYELERVLKKEGFIILDIKYDQNDKRYLWATIQKPKFGFHEE